MSSPELSDYSILVVDDSPLNLRLLMDYLNRAGFKTLLARSGENALRQIEYSLPDLILLDIMMPGIDGFETCRQLKTMENARHIPVIFMTALTDTADKIKGFRLGAVDYITKPFNKDEVLARIQTHLTIQKQRKALSRLNADKDRFFSIISHDLRGPITGITSHLDYLTEAFEDLSREQIWEVIEALHRTASKTHNLLESLLEWSQIQQGAMQYQPQMMDLFEIAAGTVVLYQEKCQLKSIDLQLKITAETMAYGDAEMVSTVLRNLVSNATKFTSSGGTITIDATPKDAEIQVSVQDNGIGMAPTVIEKVFRIDEKYVQSGTAGESGTGLGLVLCQELVAKNQGKLWVESEPGEGTTFFFTVPSQPPDSAEESDAAEAATPVKPKS